MVVYFCTRKSNVPQIPQIRTICENVSHKVCLQTKTFLVVLWVDKTNRKPWIRKTSRFTKLAKLTQQKNDDISVCDKEIDFCFNNLRATEQSRNVVLTLS